MDLQHCVASVVDTTATPEASAVLTFQTPKQSHGCVFPRLNKRVSSQSTVQDGTVAGQFHPVLAKCVPVAMFQKEIKALSKPIVGHSERG